MINILIFTARITRARAHYGYPRLKQKVKP